MSRATDWLTLIEAAAECGLDPGTLRQQIHAGRLAGVKRGRDWWVEHAEIRRYRRESLGQPGVRPRKARGKRPS